jgi:hypothetical protein
MLGSLSACATGPNAIALGQQPLAVNQEAGAGVYFPTPTSAETREPEFRSGIDPGPERRQFFTDQVNLAAATSARQAPIVVQAVGEERRTLVFTVLETTSEPTPYLARALLARATSIIRFAPAIAEMGISQDFDVYNMASLLGFTSIVVTDGRDFAHEIRIQTN